MKLNMIQLHWATLQANPDRRASTKAALSEARLKSATEVITFADKHFTT